MPHTMQYSSDLASVSIAERSKSMAIKHIHRNVPMALENMNGKWVCEASAEAFWHKLSLGLKESLSLFPFKEVCYGHVASCYRIGTRSEVADGARCDFKLLLFSCTLNCKRNELDVNWV